LPSVKNESSNTIYYKPEGTVGAVEDAKAYPLSSGTDLYLPVDGVAAPSVKTNSIFKVVDGQQVIITNTSVTTSTIPTDNVVGVAMSFIADVLKGGWKSKPPAVNFNELFEKSKK
jgi:hypothetical protein